MGHKALLYAAPTRLKLPFSLNALNLKYREDKATQVFAQQSIVDFACCLFKYKLLTSKALSPRPQKAIDRDILAISHR